MKVILLTTALCVFMSPASAQRLLRGEPVLRGEPAIGAVKEGARVLVNDGTCPRGQIKEIVGGNVQRHIARQSRCIRRR